MKKIIALHFSILILIFSAGSLSSQDIEYYGADSVFTVNDIAVFWAILKGPEIDTSKVYINIVPLDLNKLEFTRYSVVAANVFSKEEEIIKDLQPLENENLIIQEYGSFSRMSKRRLLFFGGDDSSYNPNMEIYYNGVPDKEQIQAFFQHSLKMIQTLSPE
ncbi:hypothetical protein KA005_14330 [bacterium]|nr:hypothetical protein [bacterium]